MNIGPIIKTFLKTTKGKVISVGGGTAVAVGIGAAVLLQGSGYRSIAVEQVVGTVNVVGERNNGPAFVGENLYSGDDVSVMDASELTMCMDGDKYVYADANTHFMLEASDKSEDSRIKIHLDAGSELNVLENKLGENETYEVDTPNSTMSVRGTRFRVTVYKGPDGLIYTLMEVEEGQVLVRLKTTDGSYNGVEQLFTPGQSAFIRGNSSFSEFVMTGMLDSNDLENGDDDSNKLKLAYDNLPEDGMERLIALLDKLEASKTEESEEEPEEEPVEEVEEEEGDEEAEEEESALDIPLADTKSVFEQMYDAAVTGIDPETGYLILSDGTLFDPAYYARNNPDVVEKFGSSDEELLAHYLIYGKDEKRSPSEKAAKDKDKEWKAFAKFLEDDAAEKARAAAEEEAKKNAVVTSNEEGDDGNNGNGGGGTITYTLNGNVVLANGVPIGTYSVPYMTFTQGGSYTLPIDLGNNQTVTYTSIDWWGSTQNGNSITLNDSSADFSGIVSSMGSGASYSGDITVNGGNVSIGKTAGNTAFTGSASNTDGVYDILTTYGPGTYSFGNITINNLASPLPNGMYSTITYNNTTYNTAGIGFSHSSGTTYPVEGYVEDLNNPTVLHQFLINPDKTLTIGP